MKLSIYLRIIKILIPTKIVSNVFNIDINMKCLICDQTFV